MINRGYFNFLVDIVCDKKKSKYYSQLLETLYDTEFVSYDIMDDCRISDGYRLRDLYSGYVEDSEYYISKPCSILEMMVAFARRIEMELMYDCDLGDRTGHWFWKMIGNLGLLDQDNGRFNELYVTIVLHRFVEKQYESDGKGGLFYIENAVEDVSEMDIWSQMCLYMNERR